MPNIEYKPDSCIVGGVDIGTTSISAVVIDIANKKRLKTYTVPYDFNISGSPMDFSEQDADGICSIAVNIANEIADDFPSLRSVGVTGQMHGILYVDSCGNAVSPLYNWQDKRGDRISKNNKTYCEEIIELTGMPVSTRFGLVIHYYNSKNSLVPAEAVKLCSIMDYIAMKLTGNAVPVVHNTVAASFGLFDIGSGDFHYDAIRRIGLSDSILPDVTDDFRVYGKFRDASVSVAIGDNQASFLGSVKNINTDILVNIGTGSQISAITDSLNCTADTEIRPLVKNKFIKCGSALCGGSSYALLEKFFREYAKLAGFGNSSQYAVLNEIIKSAYDSEKLPLTVNTTFSGKGSDPHASGSITGITTENFTPANLALGFIHGICNELHEYFKDDLQGKTRIIASGNAVQKLDAFRRIISDVFSLPVKISSASEEASMGTALFSAVSSGLIDDVYSFSEFINYNN